MEGNATPFQVYTETEKEFSSDTPTMSNTSPTSEVPTKKIKVRYFVGNLVDKDDVAMLENIMTTSLHCGDDLKNKGDIRVINEVGSFDKDGCYQVVVKYFEYVE